MKRNFVFLSIILISGTLLISCNQNAESQSGNKSEFTELTGPYLGQTPPGETAELFAPGLLTTGGDERQITFSSDGKAFCYTIVTGGYNSLFMFYSHLEDDHWTDPKEFLPDLAGIERYHDRYPFISSDGKRIYFESNFEPKRPTTHPPGYWSPGIWYVEKQDGGWSDPKEIHFKEGLKGRVCYPTAAANGNLYFALWPNTEKAIICMSRYENGKYSSPEKLSNAMNDRIENHPYIAPDESYILFDSERNENSHGRTDLFISFRDKNGQWMKAKNMGKRVNSIYEDARPFVTFDGKYLFFASNRINPELPDAPISLNELQQLTNGPANGNRHIYWVDAKVIEDLRPNELK